MQRGLAGFVGGLIGGLSMLILDQITFTINISNVNSIGIMSRFLSPAGGGISPVAAWLIGILITGVVGWFVGITWSMGISSLIINLIAHLVTGVIITYTLWRNRVEVVEH